VFAVNAQNLSATNSFTVIVLTPDLPPSASNHSYHAIPGSTLVIATPGVLAGAADPYGQSLAALLVNGPANGILNLGSNGEFSYVPTNGFTGTDSFTYQASDQFNHSVTATVAITVQPFQILSLNVLNGVASISWSSLSNSSYRVQYLTNLADLNWTNLVPDVLATGPVTTFTNILGNSSQQYYRILLLQ
jgi:hypothetical protein